MSLILGTRLADETCCNCGIQFAMPADFQARRRDDHEWFYCPRGHKQHYTGETETARLRRELQAVRAEAERTQAYLNSRICAEKSAANGAAIRAGKAKAKLARTLERIGAGVCPHCQRTFKQLAAHMKCKHGRRA
jgi:hypothetical protein